MDYLVETASNFVLPVLVGGIASVLANHFRNLSVSRRFYELLDQLERHLNASLRSMDELQPDQPKYLLAARIRYCRFLADVDEIRHGWWLRRSMRRAQKELVLCVRNSDIFVNEAASRIDGMNDIEINRCIEDVRENLRILRSSIEKFKKSGV